ncbi:MAG: hypothetical protein NZM43_13850, partial [Saprospiraceae bacterium]|nr:hypothetical protein [Saprospiraceae bacterium]MDW8485399.1 hypothetical protein [Saprospiraceae bacterium]
MVFVAVQALSDEAVEQLLAGLLLRNIFLALKHAGEDEDVRLNFRQLLIFARADAGLEVRLAVSEATFLYLQRSGTLTKEEVMDLIQTLPSPFEERAKTTYEQILEKGREEGRKEG